ncbi:hypothetical protein [Streptomyces fulvorobeus]|uniref:Uncharacterized protein YecE (DUF72 family) n=1 Tax=Streptomyces fulvorobeus TaxID=284028 RepID=A0A7J0C5J1_9ACTN|nr:hypothetical protein [Streptomyces fulvorobeus]NYE41089.1 uncharacterized protein YecE (DUF72 family) [Streptomyces fulvorobeus]GFM97417.1 hypothetical protein Sfulv_22280 [Streptomyces fulvorobeus]
MLKYEDIVDAPVAKLKTAADDWAEMVTKLDRLAQDAANGMKAKADKAEWEGANAGVTREFIRKTAAEFKDAAAEAKGVGLVMADAHTAIKKAKDDLVTIRDVEGPAAGIHVDAKGRVTARHPLEKDNAARHDPDYSELLSKQRASLEAWQKKIDLIVDNCNDTDVAFKNALETNVTEGKDFNAPTYRNLDQEEAARAAQLATKGRELTHTELQALNELLHDNSRSQEFSKNFYEKLGPEKSLAFFGQLATDTHDYGKVDKERLRDVQELQRNLGLNLATASHDKAFTAEWGPELRKLGTEQIPLSKYDNSGGAYGYQLLGGIMRNGNYDAKFLNPIAEHVAQLHQKDPYLFANNKQINGFLEHPFNPSGKNGAGYDPTTAMLEALGHSPDAAKHFFSDPPTAYNEDGTVNKGVAADLGKDQDGKVIGNYLDFFGNEKWEAFPDTGSGNPDDWKPALDYMPDALGHALESATTGHAWDDASPELTRDETTAAIMKDVIDTYGGDSGLRDRHEAMKDSLGRMGAAYIDDLNYSTYNFGGVGDELGRDGLFAKSSDGSERTDFGEAETRRFMAAVASDDEGYKTLSAAQQIYEVSGLQSFEEGRRDEALVFGGNGTKVHGILDESRNIGIAQEFKEDEDRRNLEMEKKAEWRKYGVSSAVAGVVGVGSAVVLGPAAGLVAVTAVPLIMETVGGAVDTQYATDTLQHLKDAEYSNDDEALDSIDQNDRQGQASAVAPILHYADSVGMTLEEKRELLADTETHYNNGVLAARQPMKVN